jgi:hypothetical protein
MQLDTSDSQRAAAKLPHNIFMLNLAVFHLLMTPAAIALGIGRFGLLLPLSLSLATMLGSYIYCHRMEPAQRLFEYLHWRLALQRFKYLLIAYGAAALLLLVGGLLSLGSADSHMRDILQTVFIRIGIMPVLLAVMVNFYLESNAISLASQGVIPDTLMKKYQAETGA